MLQCSQAESETKLSLIIPQLLKHLVPAFLLKHQLIWWRNLLAFIVLLAQLSERGIDVILIDHDAGLGAAGFGAQLGAEAVEVEFAFLEVGVGLELVPAKVSQGRVDGVKEVL